MPRTAQRFHEDPGLQPERTVLSWGRTMLALCTAAAIFLRWLPTHGPFVLALFGLAACTAIGIYTTQQARYRRGSVGISNEHVEPDAVAVVVTSTVVVALGVLGLVTVVVF